MARRPNIGRLRRRGDVDGLRAALDHRDYTRTRDGDVVEIGASSRQAAVHALAELDSASAFDGLCAALDDPEPGVREAALDILSQRTDPEVVGPLAKALVSWPADDPDGVDAVWTALAGINGRIGVAPLVVSELLAADGELGGHGVLLIAALDTSPSRDRDEQEVLELVMAAVRGADRGRRRRALQILAWLGDRAAPALLSAAQDGAPHPELALALGRTHDRRATPALLSLLGSTDVELRRAAARGLAEMRDPRAAQALVRASDDDDFDVRTAAIEAVNRLGAVAVILSVAATTDTHLEPAKASEPAPAELPSGLGNGTGTPATDEPKLRRLASALRRTR